MLGWDGISLDWNDMLGEIECRKEKAKKFYMNIAIYILYELNMMQAKMFSFEANLFLYLNLDSIKYKSESHYEYFMTCTFAHIRAATHTHRKRRFGLH